MRISAVQENEGWQHAIVIQVSPRGGLWLPATCDRFDSRRSPSVQLHAI